MHSLLYNMQILVSVIEIKYLQHDGKGSVILHYLASISHQMLISYYVTSDTYEIGHLNSFDIELNFACTC